MGYRYYRVVLGILLFYACSIIYSYDNRHNATYISVINNHSVEQQQDQSGFTVRAGSSNFTSSLQSYINSPGYIAMVAYQNAKEEIGEDLYKKYKKNIPNYMRKESFLKASFQEILDLIGHSANMPEEEAWYLWNLYCEPKTCFHNKTKRKGTARIIDMYKARKNANQPKPISQVDTSKQKQNKAQDKKAKHCEEVYSYNILDLSDEDSPYRHERQLALQQTQQEGYKQHEVSYEFDEQVTGLMKSQGIDPQQFQSLSGTLFQHQLFQEVAQYYKKAAKVVYEYQLDNGLFVPSILQFGQCALRATSLEQLGLAIQLNDLSDFMAETSLSICKGAIGSACNLVELGQAGCSLLAYCVDNPTALSEKFYTLLGRVINTLGNGVSAIASNEDGWAMYANCLEQQYQFSKQYAQEVVGQFKKWCKETTLQDKVELGSQVAFDALLFSMAGKACSGIMSQIPEIRFLEGFADILAEYGLATEFGEVGLTSLEKAGMSLMESEVKAVSSKTAQSVSKTVAKEFTSNEKLIKATHNKEFWSRKGANGVANNANGREGLVDKIKSLLSGQKKAAKVRELPDGRIRYYKAEKPSKNPGPTRGSSYVTEYDLRRGIVRCWQESYDQLGRVNRVHPKSINGKDVVGQHYPPIGKEIEFWKTLKE